MELSEDKDTVWGLYVVLFVLELEAVDLVRADGLLFSCADS